MGKQEQVAAWVAHNFPDDTPETVVLGLAEETGEVCRASLKRFQGIRGTREEWSAEIRKECADVLLKLYHVAVVEGFDLGEALDERWAEISKRDWQSNKIGHGIGA